VDPLIICKDIRTAGQMQVWDQVNQLQQLKVRTLVTKRPSTLLVSVLETDGGGREEEEKEPFVCQL